MPVESQFISKKWFSQYRNGDNLDENLSDFTSNLRGNQGERVKFVGDVIIYQFIKINNYFISYTDWTDISQGFSLKCEENDLSELSIGDSIKIIWESGASMVGDVTSVSEDLIFCDNVSGDPQNSGDPSLSNGTTREGTDYLIVTTPNNFLKYKWGFSDSNGSNNTVSKLDGRTKSFEIEGISNTTQDATNLLINDNNQTLKVTRLPNQGIPENRDVVNENEAQVFRIEHTFIIDDYNQDDIDDLIDGSIPDRYLGEITQNYYSEYDFRSVGSAPETSKTGSYIDESDVGWYNEKFNEGLNDYRVSNIEIKRISNNEELEFVSSQEPTRINLTVTSDNGSLGGGLRFHAVHKTLLTADEYEFKNIDFETLFDFENLRTGNLDVESGAIIKNLHASNYQSPNSVDIQFDIELNKSYTDTNYITSIIIGDPTLNNANRKTVTIPISVGEYYNDFDVEGLIGDANIELFPRDCDPYLNDGYQRMPIISGELIYTKLTLPVIDGEIRNISLETINFDNEDFDLVDSISIDTSSFVVVNDEQEINKSLPSPYGTGFNGVIRKVSSGLYEVIFPYRLPFEKLVAVRRLSDSLFNQNEPNQGWNTSTFYQHSQGVNVHISYNIGMFAEGKITQYQYRTPALTILDFETTL